MFIQSIQIVHVIIKKYLIFIIKKSIEQYVYSIDV